MKTVTISFQSKTEEEFSINNKVYRIGDKKTQVKVLITDTEEKISIVKMSEADLNITNRRLSFKDCIIILISMLFIYIFDLFTQDIKRLSDLIQPLSEQYYLPVKEDEQEYNLTYVSGEFIALTGEYRYPYFEDDNGIKLQALYQLDKEQLKISVIYAKIYHSFTGIVLSFITAIGISITDTDFSFLTICIFLLALYLLLENAFIEKKRKRLITQLMTQMQNNNAG